MSKKKKSFPIRRLTTIGAALLIFLSLVGLISCNIQEEETPQRPTPKTQVEILDLDGLPTLTIKEIGVIKPERSVELIARAAGTVDNFSARLGDSVSKGQVIMKIDPDDSNNPAKVNYDTAVSQLNNARQNYDEVVANNQDAVEKAQLRVETLETSLGRLQRNLEELKSTNISQEETLKLQVENAETNVENAQVNYEKTVEQFEQSWNDLLNNAKNTFDGVLINIDSNYETLNSILNPGNSQHLRTGDLPRTMGVRDSAQKTQAVNAYNDYEDDLSAIHTFYDDELPLTELSLEPVMLEFRDAVDEQRQLLANVRKLLDNSLVSTALPEAALNSYKSQVASAESRILGDLASLNKLEQSIQSLELNERTQTTTVNNSLVVARNQLSDAENGLNNFRITSRGSVRDMETQIEQTTNDLLGAQADLASARRNLSIQTNSQRLQIQTSRNQVRLAEGSLDNNQLSSPIDGVLSELAVDEGDYVSPGARVGKVINNQSLKIQLHVAKDVQERLFVGQRFYFQVPNDGMKEYEGQITKIAPSADPLNKKFLVEGEIRNADGGLKPETFINVHMDLSQETFDREKIYVPLNAVIVGQNEQFVFVVQDGKAKERKVTIVRVFDGWAEVEGELTQKEDLVVEGHRGLTEGALVEIQ
jgi:multidrug efflux pump subunit AcrA (membrane-fusion protein)